MCKSCIFSQCKLSQMFKRVVRGSPLPLVKLRMIQGKTLLIHRVPSIVKSFCQVIFSHSFGTNILYLSWNYFNVQMKRNIFELSLVDRVRLFNTIYSNLLMDSYPSLKTLKCGLHFQVTVKCIALKSLYDIRLSWEVYTAQTNVF